MLNKKNIIILAGAILVVWAGSLIISKIMVPDKNPARQYAGSILGGEADDILKRVCFNCHSNETQWPWYTTMPVISVLVYSDVAEAREHVNFSNWESMTEEKRIFLLKMALNEIEHDEMPPFIYQIGHPEATLSQQDLAILKERALALGISFNPGSSND
ncbi:MAG: heme-binding domain-containing protein [bacterium]